jgi:hypothetical protein
MPCSPNLIALYEIEARESTQDKKDRLLWTIISTMVGIGAHDETFPTTFVVEPKNRKATPFFIFLTGK